MVKPDGFKFNVGDLVGCGETQRIVRGFGGAALYCVIAPYPGNRDREWWVSKKYLETNFTLLAAGYDSGNVFEHDDVVACIGSTRKFIVSDNETGRPGAYYANEIVDSRRNWQVGLFAPWTTNDWVKLGKWDYDSDSEVFDDD